MDAPRDNHGQPLAFLNVGTGIDLTIRELSEQIAQAVGYSGRIRWDTSKPDGTPKKQLNVSRLSELGWKARIPLTEGLPLAYEDFLNCITTGRLRGHNP